MKIETPIIGIYWESAGAATARFIVSLSDATRGMNDALEGLDRARTAGGATQREIDAATATAARLAHLKAFEQRGQVPAEFSVVLLGRRGAIEIGRRVDNHVQRRAS
jgi:hypothetical protein